MPNNEIYESKLAEFNARYNMVGFDLKTLIENEKKLQAVNSLYMRGASDSPAEQFIYFDNRTLSLIFEKGTRFNNEGKYLSSFNYNEFLTDFEELSVAKYRSELDANESYDRLLYDGATEDALKMEFGRRHGAMNKTLPTLWMERLQKNRMDLGNLRITTTDLYGRMTAENADKEAYKDSVKSMVSAYEAMKQLRASRKGFWGAIWKFIFRERNEIEQTNLETFESQVNRLRDQGYPVDKIAADITGKTVLGAKLEGGNKVVEAPSEEKNNQANIENSSLDNNAKNSNREKAQEKNLATQLMEKAGVRERYLFSEKISPTLPQPAVGDVEIVKMGVENFLDEVMKEFDAFNEKFEAKMKAGKKETAMAEYALKVFSIALVSTQQIEFDGAKESIITAQKVTDAFLKEFSPCSMDESLQKFADNYAIKNSDKIIDSLKAKVDPFLKDRLDEGFKDVRAELLPQERVQVFGEENPFVENGGKIAPQVSQAPKQNVPTLNNNNK